MDEKTPESTENETLTGSSKREEPKYKQRETWSRKLDFLIACCGFSIGLGNVWKFPFLCYRNGGGAFLIPYFVCVIIGGIPTFFLEVSLGQFMSQGGMNAWKICPLLQGIGVASAVIVFLVNCDYNVLLSWSFYYFFASMTSVLPWSHCDNDWNTVDCTVDSRRAGTRFNMTSLDNMTSYNVSTSTKSYVSDPVTEFWERKVLAISDGVDQPGVIKWDLCLCLLLAWIVVYFCIWKGIKGSGKVMYVTVTTPYILMFVLLIRGLTLEGALEGVKFYILPDFAKIWKIQVMYVTVTTPYILMFVLLIRGLTLEGALEGVKFYILPDFAKIWKIQVWADAGNQVFYSYSLAIGTLVALGSYNKFNHNSYRDCLLFAGMNTFTSILSGFVIFSVLGFMAAKQGVDISEVAESGPGLAFIAYPEAVAQLPIAPMWSTIFFLMLILLGLDSQFVGVEGLITFLVDLYPKTFRRGYRREILIGVVCIISFLVGLSMVCEGGMYVFQLFDYYSVSRTIFLIALIEMITISYVYGINRYLDNLEYMYGFRVFPLIKICWMILTPAFILGLFVLGVISYSELTYDRKSVSYHYPKWAIAIGWMMACASIMWVPIVALYRLYEADGNFKERLEHTLKPVLRKHQLTSREDLNKVTLVDDDDTFNVETSTI